MKTLATFSLIVLLVSCNSSEKKNTETSSEKKETTELSKKEETPNKKDDVSLPQQGDYASLFNLERKDCSFITAADIAAALNLPENSIKDVSENGYCNYDITLNDNSNWSLSFQWHALSKNQITKEIKSYTDEDSPLTAQISKTQDTYLCIHPFNSWLFLYNNNYDGTIQISYCKVSCRKLDKEQKEIRKKLAITLGDYLLQKHQK